ncbi:acetyl-CoA carboxylase subunit [Corynebacterium kutscheri]|uniref:Acetyl-CoA carboxylase subunit n=1 Tax=Corynebacterium kutscheri TaxID=35755 RepID=A0A0F6TCG9_9CORY|nr:acyl-CoA carboxylase subunit epsilon [Corynebacterium kutscheri]AKE40681.1 Acyl-CoA carboxylase epsilon subunit [Corynebacterium kutscheri]VEH04714.1 acetyl-CoA carboxylase subunit [Corynebacterium kutscheri]VEH11078.1 acetyl-CoA carboxylase subunit [Corynebacterium kutscheri]VEH80444.1 acetyl-CoA carboxylase subunit [Corynebacterium kutscheri]
MSDENTTEEKKPFLRVLKGNPDSTQVAAITALFASMAHHGTSAAHPHRERNLWGNIEDRLQRSTTYNPAAFQNVSFF